MTTDENLTCISMPAAGDLSAKQFLFMQVNTAGRIDIPSALGGECIGVLQDKPAAIDRAGSVAIEGVAKVVCGAVVTAGDKVMADAAGKAITLAGSARNVLGLARTTTANANELVEVVLGSHFLSP